MARFFMNSPRLQWSLESLSRKTAVAMRTLLIVGGILVTIVGLALLLRPGISLIVLTVLLGIYFTIVGVIRIVSAIGVSQLPTTWRVLEAVTGLIMLAAATLIFVNTGSSAGILLLIVTVMIGVSWIFEGILTLTEAAGAFHSGWSIASGIISIIAGLVVIFSPIASAGILITFASVIMIILGILTLVRGITFPKPRTGVGTSEL